MIDLPRYEGRDVVAISRIASRLPLAFSLAGIEVQAVMADSTHRHIPVPSYTVVMNVQGHKIRLALGAMLLPQLAVERWPEITTLPPGHGLGEILFDIVLQDLAIEVEQWCGQRPTWSCSDVAAPRPHAFKIVRLEQPNDPVGSVELDDEGLQWVADCCSDLPVLAAALDELPLLLDVRIAPITLALAELQRLAQGDVIMLDNQSVGRDGAMSVVAHLSNNPWFRASIRDCRLSVQSVVDRLMDKPEFLPPESLDSLNLTVDVDVGRLTMPLGQLRELAVGQVIDLGFDATTNVSLRVNGQVVATGELVRIAEQTGVRLLDLRLPRAER
ncbi:type III secretion system cytoplasmic ring protein SctQ [Bradyrhizobium sp. CCBAU 53421]|uniref:type III secretion system cytoplasmic ring protein SctQ n=1 Tax=Bradyrhizobium sp. CCBAU 53421 TaxID=1325120 RepID=UPI00188ACD8B|nr:type III secretion system cytoplasmic ring protein SctQ [Bradyrhizobium sp. CCBAU 53421]QOZ36258.1 YscQ/HrcQ family type III secretion apparatus protein [Bradyrhizobium sp. CCBAU 53421]